MKKEEGRTQEGQDRNREHLLIRGDFSPSARPRMLRRGITMLTMVLGLVVLSGLTLYGVSVYLSSDINRISSETRDLNEKNKELHVSLNRIRSFKNVEAAVRSRAQVSHLKEAAEVIEIPRPGKVAPLPLPPVEQPEFPAAYGY